MHSSGMRTSLLLTVSQHALWPGGYLPGGVPAEGVPAQGGVPARGGVPAQGVCTCPRGVPAQVLPLPVNRMTDRQV